MKGKYFLIECDGYFYCVPSRDLRTVSTAPVHTGDVLKFIYGRLQYEGSVQYTGNQETEVLKHLHQLKKEKRIKQDSFHEDRPRKCVVNKSEKSVLLDGVQAATSKTVSKNSSKKDKEMKKVASEIELEKNLESSINDIQHSSAVKSFMTELDSNSSAISTGSSYYSSTIPSPSLLAAEAEANQKKDLKELENLMDHNDNISFTASGGLKLSTDRVDSIPEKAGNGTSCKSRSRSPCSSSLTSTSSSRTVLKEGVLKYSNEASTSTKVEESYGDLKMSQLKGIKTERKKKKKASKKHRKERRRSPSSSSISSTSSTSTVLKEKVPKYSDEASTSKKVVESYGDLKMSQLKGIKTETKKKKKASKKRRKERRRSSSSSSMTSTSSATASVISQEEAIEDSNESSTYIKTVESSRCLDKPVLTQSERGRKRSNKVKKHKKGRCSSSSSSAGSASSSSSSSSSSDSGDCREKRRKKSKKVRRNLSIYPGPNYLYNAQSENVIKLHPNYEVYCREDDLTRSAEASKTTTNFVRLMVDKIYTTEALQGSTAQGFPARGRGKKAIRKSKVLPRLHPDGRSALLDKAYELEKDNKVWRPKAGDKIKQAFRGRVGEF